MVLLVFQFVFQVTATDWYVDNTATGANNGTSWTDAWQGFTDIVWGSIEPGDIIYISGGEIEKIYTMPGSGNYILDIQKSGTSGNPITIRPGAAHPTLSSGHDGMVIIDGEYNNGCIYSRGNDYITIDGGHDNERKIRCARSVGIAVYMSDAEGCKILWLHTYQTGTTDNTFGIYTGNTPGMEIANNDIETPYQDGLRVANLGTIDNYGQWMDIHDNWIHGMGDDGFSGGLSGCNFYNNIVGPWSNTGAGGHPDGMQVYDGVYSKIYNNLFYADVSIGGSNAFIFMNRQPSGPGSHVFDHSRIYNNIFMIAGENYDETRFVGLKIGATFNTDINHPEYNDLDDIHIVHNTFVDIGHQAISLESRRAGGDTGSQGRFTNFVIKNNIIYNSKRACCSSGVVGLSNFDIANSSVDFDYNIIHPGTAGRTTAEGYQTVNDGGAGFIGSNNIFGYSEDNIPINPPLFITYSAAGGLNNDLHLSSIDTIARDAGADLSGFTYLSLDKDGNVRPQGASWDIGAYEYTAATNIHNALTENKEILHIYPNPFKSVTTIEYTLPEGSDVEIILYDLTSKCMISK